MVGRWRAEQIGELVDGQEGGAEDHHDRNRQPLKAAFLAAQVDVADEQGIRRPPTHLQFSVARADVGCQTEDEDVLGRPPRWWAQTGQCARRGLCRY